MMRLIEEHFTRVIILLLTFIGLTMFSFSAEAQSYQFNFFNNGVKQPVANPLAPQAQPVQPLAVQPTPVVTPQVVAQPTLVEPKEDFYNKWGILIGGNSGTYKGVEGEAYDEINLDVTHVGLMLNVGDSFYLQPSLMTASATIIDENVQVSDADMKGFKVDLGFQNKLTESFSLKYGLSLSRLNGNSDVSNLDMRTYEIFLTPTFNLGKNAFVAFDGRYGRNTMETTTNVTFSSGTSGIIDNKTDYDGFTVGASIGLYF
jgi:hypothetical protein